MPVFDALLVVVRHRQRLGVALRLVVDAARADRVDVTPVRLRLRVHLRVAVDLARRREQEPRALELREPERVVRPVRADLQRVQRHPQVVDGAGERGEVVDEVDRLVDLQVLGQVVVQEDEVVVPDVLDVPQRAGDEVVDADHPQAAAEQVLAEVGAEEAGAPGDDRSRHVGSVEGGVPALNRTLTIRGPSRPTSARRRTRNPRSACDSPSHSRSLALRRRSPGSAAAPVARRRRPLVRPQARDPRVRGQRAAGARRQAGRVGERADRTAERADVRVGAASAQAVALRPFEDEAPDHVRRLLPAVRAAARRARRAHGRAPRRRRERDPLADREGAEREDLRRHRRPRAVRLVPVPPGAATLAGDGFLPILETQYVDAAGTRYRQESFSVRGLGTGRAGQLRPR